MSPNDRSIHLDVSTPGLGPRTGEGLPSGTGRRAAPDPEAQERFARALAGTEAETPQLSDPRPFALFGAINWKRIAPQKLARTPDQRLGSRAQS